MWPMDVASLHDRARTRWAGMTGKLGLGFALVGFLFIVLAWNGAASLDYTQGQIPYLISGGVSGLGLIVLGAALVIAESNRRDRALLEQRLDEMTATLARLSPVATGAAAATAALPAGSVVAGRSSYHRPDCRLAEGRGEEADVLARERAEAEGLTPCRVCKP